MAKWSIFRSRAKGTDRALLDQMASRAKNLDILAAALQLSRHLGTSLAAEPAPAEPLSRTSGAAEPLQGTIAAAKLLYG